MDTWLARPRRSGRTVASWPLVIFQLLNDVVKIKLFLFTFSEILEGEHARCHLFRADHQCEQDLFPVGIVQLLSDLRYVGIYFRRDRGLPEGADHLQPIDETFFVEMTH